MTVHYINRGTKYHIGNDDYGGSVDKEFIDAYPVVGQAWAQPFVVSHDDVIEIVIENLWGVDYGNNNQVYINDQSIGEIRGEHNRSTWTSPGAYRVSKGQTYLIKIASHGPGDPDDFVFQGVMVKTRSGAKVSTKGNAKVLHTPDEDYWTSDYDTGRITGATPTSHIASAQVSQAVVCGELFPSASIKSYWEDDYFITFLTYTGGTWVVVMTKGGPYGKQRWLTRKELSNKEFTNAWNDDFEITELTASPLKYGIVLSGPRQASGQFWASDNKFPKKAIEKQWKDGHRITSIEYRYEGWLLVTHKGSNNLQQIWVTEPDFPSKEIDKNWDDGLAITDITYGEGQGWVLIMTKSKMGQVLRGGSSQFPEEEIRKGWADGYKVSCITYGDNVWVVTMDK